MERVRTMRRFFGYTSVALGVVLLILAGVTRWVIAPALTVLPSDTNTTRVYTGTINSVVNPTLLTGTLFGPAILRDLPATVVHSVKVTKTSGDNALVTDRRVVTSSGSRIANVTHRYAVDRKTLGAGSGFGGVTRQTGLTFNWPLGTQPHDYAGWVADTQKPTTLHYAGQTTRGGVKTYVYDATVPPTRITDPQMLSLLPPSMTKATLTSVAPSLQLSTKALTQLSSTLAALPDPVPLVYTFSANSRYWIAPATGIVVDVVSREIRTTNVVVGGRLVPVSPVLDFSFVSPKATLNAAADDARDGAGKINLVHVVLPGVALGVGLALMVTGSLLLVFDRRRRTRTPPPPTDQPRELVEAGSR